MNKNKNLDLLNCMYRNSEMGVTAITHALSKTKSADLRAEMSRQLEHYRRDSRLLRQEIATLGSSPRRLGCCTKAMMRAEMAMKINCSSSSSHIARMMIEGTNMGVISLNKELNRAKDADEKYLSQTKDMLSAEQAYIDHIKPFL